MINLAQISLNIAILTDQSHEINPNYGSILEKTKLGDAPTSESNHENKGISVNYTCLCEIWYQNEIIINDIVVFHGSYGNQN